MSVRTLRFLRRVALMNLALPMVGVLAVLSGAVYSGAWWACGLLFVQQGVLWYGLTSVMLEPAFGPVVVKPAPVAAR